MDEYEDNDDFRAVVRQWLASNKPAGPLASGDSADGIAENLAWERTLFEGGWAVVTWPVAYGGRDLDLGKWLIFEEEYFRAGLPQRVSQNGITLLAPTLFQFGTQDQRDRYLRRMAAVEDLWCQGWSEPGAGSDLASIRSYAVRDEDAGGWRLFGQKAWSTRGAFCTHLFGLFRTGTKEERHRGLTYFLVPLSQDGVDVRAVARLDGDQGFAEVFLDGAFVADRDVLGNVGEGWRIAMATAGSERSLALRSPGRFVATVERLVEELRSAGTSVRSDRRIRAAVTDSWMAAQAYRLATDAAVSRIQDHVPIGSDASMSKIFWSELDITLHETALALRGADADLDETWMRGYEFSLAGTIYAGTSEIQRDIIAERILGLPRAQGTS